MRALFAGLFALADAARRLSEQHIARLRDVFRSFGTCSITEPLTDLTDLTALGLLDPPAR